MKSKIFISYSRKDFEVVEGLRNDIQSRTGILPWMDVSGIETGTRFADVIAKAIDDCELLIFVMSTNSIESSWTRKEVMYALNHKKKIYPVVIDDVQLPRELDFLFSDVDRVDVRDCMQREKLFSDLNKFCGEHDIEMADGMSTSVAVPSLVTCPVCGKKNDPTDTFICRGCKRENICIRHQDEETYLCVDCATKAVADNDGASGPIKPHDGTNGSDVLRARQQTCASGHAKQIEDESSNMPSPGNKGSKIIKGCLGTDAAVGAAIGSIIPGVGTILGAGIGAGIGAGVGWLKKKHKKHK